jgi:hypothetical protein
VFLGLIFGQRLYVQRFFICWRFVDAGNYKKEGEKEKADRPFESSVHSLSF